MATTNINYAKAIGIDSVAAAAIFAVLYIPLLGYFAIKSIRARSRVLKVVTVFCAIRVAAFVIRALLAGNESAGEDLNLLTADEVLLSVGFFGLLFAAYTLVIDWEESLGTQPPQNIISRIIRNRAMFRLVMVAAVAMGIAGATMTDPDDLHTGLILRRASAIYRTPTLSRVNESFGTTHGIYVLLAISIFLMIREVYATATAGNITKVTNEKLWYPLFALPELLAIICYAAPGLIPISRIDDMELQGKQVHIQTSA
ncbi:hypothetical protein BDQ17DRAFT_1367507 [Cyathus striatus]|nr:hypothetical protein BDQ17DRAFT_1367507 [Cyathus striatus]